MSEIDLIAEVIGNFGRYQVWIWVVIMLGHFSVDFQINNVLFVLPDVEYMCEDEGLVNASNYCPCGSPNYDRSTIVESATSEWNLICERKHLASLAQSMFLAGMLTGSLLCGYISDRYGRKIAVIMALLAQPAFGTISAFVTEYWMFAICRFLTGNAVGGSYITCYVLLMELSGKSFRPYLAGLLETSNVLSHTLLAMIAYYLRDWRDLQLATSAPWFAVVIYFWILQESPRWLITVGKKKEAIFVLTYIAKKNNRPTDDIENSVNIIERDAMFCENNKRFATYIDLLKTPNIRKYTIINGLIWLCCVHAFFGICQNIGRLSGDIYHNLFLTGLLLIPAVVLTTVAAVYLSRKLCSIITFSASGVSLIVYLFLRSDLLIVAANVFALIAYIFIFSAFVLMYLYTTEVFPTVVRNSAMGFASMCGRIGGLVSPFVVNIGIPWVSVTILSVLSFFAAFLCCFLPETKDTVLQNSIEQTEQNDNSEG